MTRKLLLSILVLFLGAAPGAMASFTFYDYDFNEFGIAGWRSDHPLPPPPADQTVGTNITSQYPSVTFSLSGAPGVVYISDALHNGGVPSQSLGNNLAVNTHEDFDINETYLTITFPGAGTLASNFSVFVADSENSVMFTAYDEFGVVIGTFNLSNYFATVTFLGNPNAYIKTIVIRDQFADGFILDDLRFSTGTGDPIPAPEPSTMALLGTALGGLALWKRRQRRSS